MHFLGPILLFIESLISILIVVGVSFYFGVVRGRKNPIDTSPGFVGFKTEIRQEFYDSLMIRGNYENENELMIDALSVLNWTLDSAHEGRYICSCDNEGESLIDFTIDTFSKIRASANPVSYLERCLNMDINSNEENGD